MVFRLIQDGGNAALCLGHRLNGHVQAADIRREARNRNEGAVWGVWEQKPQPTEANGGLGAPEALGRSPQHLKILHFFLQK